MKLILVKQRRLIEHVKFEGDYHSYARRYGYILRRQQRKRQRGWVRRAIRIAFLSDLISHWRLWRERRKWR